MLYQRGTHSGTLSAILSHASRQPNGPTFSVMPLPNRSCVAASGNFRTGWTICNSVGLMHGVEIGAFLITEYPDRQIGVDVVEPPTECRFRLDVQIHPRRHDRAPRGIMAAIRAVRIRDAARLRT